MQHIWIQLINNWLIVIVKKTQVRATWILIDYWISDFLKLLLFQKIQVVIYFYNGEKNINGSVFIFL